MTCNLGFIHELMRDIHHRGTHWHDEKGRRRMRCARPVRDAALTVADGGSETPQAVLRNVLCAEASAAIFWRCHWNAGRPGK